MTLKRRRLFRLILISTFGFFLIIFMFKVKGFFSPRSTNAVINFVPPVEEYNPSLIRLNSMDKVIAYCDSVYLANYPNRTYPGIVSEVIRNKFYHGYSYYDAGTDPFGVVLEPIVRNGATAVVIPDDIVKYPHAACSQQSIVGMEIFKRKGYDVRTVGMFDTVNQVGHFTYEVYYDNSWHFFDTNQEPDADILKKYNRPSVAFLANHPDIVGTAYRKQSDPLMFERLIKSYKLGPMNNFPAPQAYFFQRVTIFLSNFGWLLSGCALLFFHWYTRRKDKRAIALAARVHDAAKPSFPSPEKVMTLDSAKVV